MKLNISTVLFIFSVIESFVGEQSDELSEKCLNHVIELCIMEMTKSSEHLPLVQNPALEALVSVGRVHCGKVMDYLLGKLQQGQVAHFMIIHCIGSLATANISGIIPYVRPTFEIILPTLSSIKADHVKQAYSFGIYITTNLINFPKITFLFCFSPRTFC